MSDNTIPDVPVAADTDVFITRAFAAPREVVWQFFTKPEFLARWFGPASVHVDLSTVRVNLREGGVWGLDMVDNESGEHYPMLVHLTVVIPPEYLEGYHPSPAVAQGGPFDRVVLRIWLHDHGDKTRMTLHQGPFEPQFRDMTRDGWLESFDKMDAVIEGDAA
ncbi:uncharacterized protein YndB with AHSA1/START domain [Microbacteriaceae bacterium SG_E_30_P1]|uniref:Uncharacterized protein YndB with AHSA1/START domain n=1 Tax=Antiquaquibacter oligotrophicus TaxID=2880260 RepID=A0ABT6KNR0_9MICO|nr:SRPBCC domain-containing protein [Antiquaquibacter oligotrophicus]MDH6181504.1 uncharacterized protein YndB with AHSA1/START domain [Antiquaquibacter oligotrophicus]UDF12806.1 SRPBCC domain-containing protein [Antiquaquibacter oligotrophicus]